MSSKEGSYPPLDLTILKPQGRRKVEYFYDHEVADFSYREGHPMQPQRIDMAHSLVMNTGVCEKLYIYRAKPVTSFEMKFFHSKEYIDFLEKVAPGTTSLRFGIDKSDSPAFEGVFKYSAICAAGSLEGAARLGRGNGDISINWSGGHHHSMKGKASGFCYINDSVLGIMELLRHYARVLYIDIDVHHGDGVETAFLTSDRVMTVSFHQYDPGSRFFPRTGSLGDIGHGKGRNFAINFPLNKGIDDASYKGIFEPVIEEVMARFRPSAIVLQCGADSLSQDKLGSLNLSMRGHANCVEFVKRLSVPTMVVGGGGYTIHNVARTWAYETGVLVGTDLQPSELPNYDKYFQYYAPDFKLDVSSVVGMKNHNSFRGLEAAKIKIFENLRGIAGPPSVQIQDVPQSSLAVWTEEAEDANRDKDEDDNPDVRNTVHRLDRKVQNEGELSDNDGEFRPEDKPDASKRKRVNRQSPGRRNSHNHGDDTEHAGQRNTRSKLETQKTNPSQTKGHGCTSSLVAPKKTQKKNPQNSPVCANCRHKKVKCDKARPFCGTCVQSKKTHLCVYGGSDGTIGLAPSAELVSVAEEMLIPSETVPTQASGSVNNLQIGSVERTVTGLANLMTDHQMGSTSDTSAKTSMRVKLPRSAKDVKYPNDEWKDDDFESLDEEQDGDDY